MKYYHLRSKRTVPPGGWRFVTDDNFEIKGGTFDKCVGKVKQHLISNGEPLPDNLAEVVEDFIARHIPASMIVEPIYDRFPTEKKIFAATRKLVDQMGPRRIVEAEAETTRQEACRCCPMNTYRWGCFHCDAAYKHAFRSMGLAVDRNGLLVCDLTATLCAVLCRTPRDMLLPMLRDIPADVYLDRCWLKEIAEVP